MDSLLLGLRVLVSLAAVFGLMWLVSRRLRAGNPGLRARVLSVVARQSVGAKASVVVVETDGKRFLLGVTEHGITVLHTGTAPEPDPVAVPSRAGGVPGSRPESAAGHPDPSRDAETTGATSFQEVLEQQQADEQTDAAAPRPTGSVLDPATWRLAADAIRTGRRS